MSWLYRKIAGRANHYANHFTVRAIQYLRAITPQTYSSDFPSEWRVQWFVLENGCLVINRQIFENFRNSCITSYCLDLALLQYILPSFTWDAMLKCTRVRFELTDIDMVMFIESDIRGGLSQCSGRYAQANKKYACRNIIHSYDPSKLSSYYDVNNLYRSDMSTIAICRISMGRK